MRRVTKIILAVVVIAILGVAGVTTPVAAGGNDHQECHQKNEQSNEDSDLVDADVLNGNAIAAGILSDDTSADGGDTGNQENEQNCHS